MKAPPIVQNPKHGVEREKRLIEVKGELDKMNPKHGVESGWYFFSFLSVCMVLRIQNMELKEGKASRLNQGLNQGKNPKHGVESFTDMVGIPPGTDAVKNPKHGVERQPL